MKLPLLISLLTAGALAQAETYKIDTTKSTVAWTGTKITGAKHVGGILIKEGSVDVNKGQLTGGNFTADMNSVTNDDLKGSPEYHAKLLGHLKSDDFFNVQKFPETKFVIKSVTMKGKSEALIKGDFTMIGQTQPIEFPAKIDLQKDIVKGEATLKIDRTKWGLKYGSNKFFQNLGDKVINDEIEIALKLEATKTK